MYSRDSFAQVQETFREYIYLKEKFMKFIHTGDIHWGMTPDADKPWGSERAQAIKDTFKKIIAQAGKMQADCLFISGDLFHRQPLVRDLKEVNYLFSTLKKTKVVFIIGNHDYLKVDSYYLDFPWSENVTCLRGKECESVVFEDLDTEVYGLSYHTREIKEPKYNDLQPEKKAGFSILLGHGGDAKHIPIDRKKLLLSGFDYIALGHIHRPEMIEPDRMAYAGALEPIDQNDIGPHGFIEGEYNEGKLSISFVPWACREYIPLELDTKECPTNLAFQETVRMRMAAKGMQHIYKVLLQGYRDPDIVYDLDACRKLGNIVSVQDESVPDYDFERLMRVHAGDIAGRYIQTLYHKDMSDTERKALYYGIHALLEMRG